MGLFNFFKKSTGKQLSKNESSSLPWDGPAYLRQHLMAPDEDMRAVSKLKHPQIQWAGQLVSSTGNRCFTIKYYGELLNEITIVGTSEAVMKVVAVDDQSGEEILLFDKAIHGWDGYVCDAYSEDKLVNRSTEKIYTVAGNAAVFKIVFVAWYNATEENLEDEANEEGMVELNDKTLVSMADACANAFDALVVYGIDKNGRKFEIINEELA